MVGSVSAHVHGRGMQQPVHVRPSQPLVQTAEILIRPHAAHRNTSSRDRAKAVRLKPWPSASVTCGQWPGSAPACRQRTAVMLSEQAAQRGG